MAYNTLFLLWLWLLWLLLWLLLLLLLLFAAGSPFGNSLIYEDLRRMNHERHELCKVWRGEAVEWDPTQGSEERLFQVVGELGDFCKAKAV